MKNSLNNKPKVILLHGLYMHAFGMKPLANELSKKHGLECYCYGYYSMMHPIAKHSERLNEYLTNNFDDESSFYLVGHSLGGLVIRDFLHRYPAWTENGRIQRVVTIGTPHSCSQTAHNLMKILPMSIGNSYRGALDGSTPDLIENVELGVIAGNKSVGLGQLIMKKDWRELESDGTVFLQETNLANQKDHITLPHTHTSLILSPAVAMQIAYFLEHGEFKKA